MKTAHLFPCSLVLLLAFSAPLQAAESLGSWVQVSLGLNGMAMDDVNNTEFRWHEDSPNGFDLKDISTGMALSFGVGYDMSEVVGYGLFWEHQYASTKGNDQGMEADVNLSADIFNGKMHVNFLRKKSWNLAVAGALGYLVANGDVNQTTSGASYGQTDIQGSSFSLEGMLQLEIAIGDKTRLQVTGGYRQAKVDKFKNGGAYAIGPDGNELSLDYSGFTTRVGLKYRFGNVQDQTTPDIN